MRIISGKFKGRRFYPPAKNWPTRPTTDFNKEALYNILQNEIDFEETRFLDLFGGTGSHCLECISRGCKDATYVDKFAGAVSFVIKMAKELEVEDYLSIRKMDVFRYIRSSQESFDYIFAGPPYPLKTMDQLPNLILEKGLLAPEGTLILEHDKQFKFEDHPRIDRVKQYSQTYFSFFR